MSAFLISNPTLGTIWASKTLNFTNQPGERPGEKNRSLTGKTIHQVGTAEDSDREVTGTIRVSESDKSVLLSMLTTTANFLLTLQDGEDAYKGYIKALTPEAQISPHRHRYTFVFFVTEKLT